MVYTPERFIMNKIYNFFGGRRYFFAEQIFIVSMVLLLYNKIKPENFVDISIWTLGIYAGSNLFQKLGETMKGKKEQ